MSEKLIESFKAVSFDCFGTLVDWQSGQSLSLQTMPSLRGSLPSIRDLIAARETEEIELQKEGWRSYHEILQRSLHKACSKVLDVQLTDRELEFFADSQPNWPAFPDSDAALKRLSEHVPVALLSNCDDAILKLTASRQFPSTPISHFISAELVQSYKPHHGHWGALLAEMACEPEEVLHVSFADHYDLKPAQELGFSLGFVGRYGIQKVDHRHVACEADSMEEFASRLL